MCSLHPHPRAPVPPPLDSSHRLLFSINIKSLHPLEGWEPKGWSVILRFLALLQTSQCSWYIIFSLSLQFVLLRFIIWGGVGEEIEGVALDYRNQKPTEQVILFRGFLRSPHPSSSGSPPTPKDVAKPQLSSSMAAPHFHSSSSLQVQVQVQPG